MKNKWSDTACAAQEASPLFLVCVCEQVHLKRQQKFVRPTDQSAERNEIQPPLL